MDNEGWIIADNTEVSRVEISLDCWAQILQELRARLGWLEQMDGHNCGPFAVAAAISISQGLKPSWLAMGFGAPKPSIEETKALRDLLSTIAVNRLTMSSVDRQLLNAEGLLRELQPRLDALGRLAGLSEGLFAGESLLSGHSKDEI